MAVTLDRFRELAAEGGGRRGVCAPGTGCHGHASSIPYATPSRSVHAEVAAVGLQRSGPGGVPVTEDVHAIQRKPLFSVRSNPDLGVMNHESPEAFPRQAVEPSSPSMPNVSNPPEPSSAAADSETAHVASAPLAATGAEDQAASPAAGSPGSSAVRRPIQIGSRRNFGGPGRGARPASSVPVDMDEPPPPEQVTAPKPTAPVTPPSTRDPLSPDLEAAFAAAMGNASLDEMLQGSVEPTAAAPLEMESRHRATVTHLHGDNVFFSLGGRNEGVASLRQFTAPPPLGSEVEVIVKAFLSDEGLYELVVPGASTHVEDWSDLVEGTIVEARITGANTGGLECKVGTVRGFIPSSHIAMFRVEDYAEYIDQKLLCMVTEVNPRRKNLVLSRRAVLEREKEQTRQQLLESIQEGQVVEGVVRKLLDFGAFVDIGGLDGLVHVSKLSWDHVQHPSEVLQEGQKVLVKIEKVDAQTGKIGLSVRDLLDHPWTNIEEKFSVNTVVQGTVSRIAKFGAFVKLAPGIEGLVHISELSHGRVPSVGSVVSEGQQVDVKVVSIDGAAQRIALSMKAVLPEPESEPEDDVHGEASQQESRREPSGVRATRPLKGGIGRESGGERFGLKW